MQQSAAAISHTRKRSFFRRAFVVALCVLVAHQIWANVIGPKSSQSEALTESESSNGTNAEHPVTIRRPEAPNGVESGIMDAHGVAVTVSCQTCHTTRPANPLNRMGSDLDEFHQGLTMRHGTLACVACHDANDGYASLHLADGTNISYADTMSLCAQCHGTQFRDYQHGSHGGMTGYWDLSRGGRQRNHCIDCHDPHAPQISIVQPAPGPVDRFPPATQDVVH